MYHITKNSFKCLEIRTLDLDVDLRVNGETWHHLRMTRRLTVKITAWDVTERAVYFSIYSYSIVLSSSLTNLSLCFAWSFALSLSLSLETLEIGGAISAVIVRGRRVRGVRVGVVDRAIRSPRVLYLSEVLSTSEGWSRAWRRLIRYDV